MRLRTDVHPIVENLVEDVGRVLHRAGMTLGAVLRESVRGPGVEAMILVRSEPGRRTRAADGEAQRGLASSSCTEPHSVHHAHLITSQAAPTLWPRLRPRLDLNHGWPDHPTADGLLRDPPRFRCAFGLPDTTPDPLHEAGRISFWPPLPSLAGGPQICRRCRLDRGQPPWTAIDFDVAAPGPC